ncbi:MAG: methylenetetrahydrofolate reductase C-terminal domain-containing protein [Anaerolineaceae bacterium]|nr:methylenetetrahydrofolate reductase C-terminal domain-containing protein [Anaerolineaceae bacterium]MBN2676929.1 methylenetetrahydrofolate reductase C-terminal domain-containing protein [Anaerolineaceae bacterium]
MPGLTPGRRWQPAFKPFTKRTFWQKLEGRVELLIKGPIFGCRMCGNCLLQETAFICPMECPKGLRNGPCGGATEVCYIDPTRPCIWYRIYQRSFKLKRQERLLEILPPMDWARAGNNLVGEVVAQVRKVGLKRILSGFMKKEGGSRLAVIEDEVFFPIRQPDWWQGDYAYHAPLDHEPVSRLESDLKSGKFVVTVEITAPLSDNASKLIEEIGLIKPHVSAINFTDSASANPRMASDACSKIALEQGAEPILQISARDHTRTVLQAKALGASAMGIHNLFVVTGDSPIIGPNPIARLDIVDLDSVQMLWILRRMRDEGIYLGGRKMKYPPKFFLGAAASPMASRPEYQAIREEKKANAGAQFFQTNVIYDLAALESWMNALTKRNVLGKVHILVGINILKSMAMAQYLDREIPGVFIPHDLMERMQEAGEGAEQEGFQIALELIEGIRKYKEVNGIHIMPVGREKDVPRLLQEAGLSG